MQEMWVRSLVWEDPLEKGIATHSSILAWEIPQTAEPSQTTVHRLAEESDTPVPGILQARTKLLLIYSLRTLVAFPPSE